MKLTGPIDGIVREVCFITSLIPEQITGLVIVVKAKAGFCDDEMQCPGHEDIRVLTCPPNSPDLALELLDVAVDGVEDYILAEDNADGA